MGYSRRVVLSVLVLDIIAFSLAIGAQTRKSRAITDTSDPSVIYCRYTRDVSTALGIVAFLFLFFGQMIITGLTRCMCCSTPMTPGGNRSFAVLFFVLSWFSFVIAEICLLAGATRAAYRTRTLDRTGPYDCASLRRGIFSAAAAFIFFTLVLAEAYYWCYCKAQDKTWQNFYGGAPTPYGNPYNPGPSPFTTGAPPTYGVPYNPGAPYMNSGPTTTVQGVPHSIGMTTYPRQ